jgi:hypothetical protein
LDAARFVEAFTQQLTQRAFAVLEGGCAQVESVEVQQVKDPVGEPFWGFLGELVLEQMKVRDTALIHHDDLPIEHEIVSAEWL